MGDLARGRSTGGDEAIERGAVVIGEEDTVNLLDALRTSGGKGCHADQRQPYPTIGLAM